MKVKLISELLENYKKTTAPRNPKKIIFHGFTGFDYYNPTAPFFYENKTLIVARVEKRDSEVSRSIFFEKKDDQYYPCSEISEFALQDPFITKIHGKYVFGGTKTYFNSNNEFVWRTDFYSGEKLENLEHFFSGPERMKDVRLAELKDGSIAVFSRPQGKIGLRGKIGFTIVHSLDELSVPLIENAPLLDTFDNLEWGGVNEVHILKNGLIGILGHIAKFTEGDVRHYYPMAFVIDPVTHNYSDLEILATRSEFLPGPAKRSDLVDVLFSGGLIRNDDLSASLYVGVSDAEVQSIEIIDPFVKYENNQILWK
ncbi:MAG: DUF1861 family protein [Acholeplasmataceae bacterium]|nr:DUF1861 family protein [Acholeplasmataceae bacterium]